MLPEWTSHFHFQIRACDSYPQKPPTIRCLTPIYHPNIDPEDNDHEVSNVCVSLLDDWNADMDLLDCVQALVFLFHNPNLDDPLSPYFDSTEMSEVEFAEQVTRSLKGEMVDGWIQFKRNYDVGTDDVTTVGDVVTNIVTDVVNDVIKADAMKVVAKSSNDHSKTSDVPELTDFCDDVITNTLNDVTITQPQQTVDVTWQTTEDIFSEKLFFTNCTDHHTIHNSSSKHFFDDDSSVLILDWNWIITSYRR